MKILCVGNEFIKEDSYAKEIGNELKKEGYEIINITDSFQLIDYLQGKDKIIIIDVVKNLRDVNIIGIDELREDSHTTAHDLDSGFFLKLFGDNDKIKIIGIPMKGDIDEIKEKIKGLLNIYIK